MPRRLAALLFCLGMSAPVLAQAPQISSLSEATLTRSGRLEVYGSGFGTLQGTSQLFVDDLEAIVTSWANDEIHGYIPESAAVGSVPVQVVASAGSSNVLPLDVTLRSAVGHTRWRFEMDSPISGAYTAVGPNGVVYATDIERMYALSATGALLWVLPGAGGGRPIVFGNDGTLYTGSDSGLVSVDPAGALNWEYSSAPLAIYVAGPGVGPDGNIYGAQDAVLGGALYSLDPSGALIWDLPGVLGLTLGGNANWKISFAADRFYTGVTWDVHCFSLDGDQLWSAGDLGIATSSLAELDPQGRVITRWAQTGLRALTEDGDTDWLITPPGTLSTTTQPVVGPNGDIYMGNFFGSNVWAFYPDGSLKWFRDDAPGIMQKLGVSPNGAVLVDGGGPGFGSPGFFRGFDTDNGDLLWQVNLSTVAGWDELAWTNQPAFTTNSATAFVTSRFAGNENHGYLYALQVGDDQDPLFVRGDVNADGSLDISDAVALLAALFGGSVIVCDDAADSNDDDLLDISDPISVLAALFGSPSVPPASPFPLCGSDPTPGLLDCVEFPACP